MVMEEVLSKARSDQKIYINLKGFVYPIIIPIIFLFVWQVSSVKIDNKIILPSIIQVLDVLTNPTKDLLSMGSLISNVFISIIRVSIGYILAALIAIPLGVIIGYSKKAEELSMTFLNSFRPIAPLAWVPLVLAWFGTSSMASFFGFDSGILYIFFSNIKNAMIFIIFIGAFYPILTNSIYGVKSVRKILIDSSLTLGANKLEIILKVLLPAAMPSIVTGLRVGLGIAWMCLVSAEMLPGSIAGIGYLINHAYTIARTDVVISGMIAISIVGGIFNYMFIIIEKKFFKWQSLSN
jgi:NitT/TauT family transport system permease protein